MFVNITNFFIFTCNYKYNYNMVLELLYITEKINVQYLEQIIFGGSIEPEAKAA